MRLDNFLSDVGVIKRRTVAKQTADAGHITVNGNRAKPGYRVKTDDIIEIGGRNRRVIRVKKLPEGKSVPKDARPEYFEDLEQ